jgi:dTDP-4-dehydrorhamnose reductase
MRILVTGAGGQLARDLIPCLAGEELLALTREQLDITDESAVRAAVAQHRPGCIVNCAAWNRVDDAEDSPAACFAVNTLGVAHLARAAAAAGAALAHFSSDYVFDGAKRAPYVETDPPNPQSLYALSKRAGELVVERTCEKYLLIRTCGLYGQGGSRRQGGNFVETLLERARAGQPLRVVNDQVVTPTSTAELAQKLVPLLRSQRYGLYHMTNAGECSWYDFAREIFRLAGLAPDLQPTSTAALGRRARRPAYSVLDNANYRAAGFPDFRPWQEALADYMKNRST